MSEAVAALDLKPSLPVLCGTEEWGLVRWIGLHLYFTGFTGNTCRIVQVEKEVNAVGNAVEWAMHVEWAKHQQDILQLQIKPLFLLNKWSPI